MQPSTGEQGASRESRDPQRAASLRFLIVADLDAVLEPCGCTSRVLGGIDRLASAIASLRAEAVPSALVFAGNLFFPLGTDAAASVARDQDTYRAQTLAVILARLRPDVVAFGTADARRGASQLAALGRLVGAPLLEPGVAPDGEAPPSETDAGRLVRERLFEAGGIRIRATGVALDTDGAQRALSAAGTQVARLDARGTAMHLVIAQGDGSRVAELARSAPGSIVVYTGDVAAHAPGIEQLSSSVIVHAGQHGEGVAVLDLHLPAAWKSLRVAANTPASSAPADFGQVAFRYQPISQDVPADTSVRARLRALFARVNARNAQAYVEPEPSRAGDATYVGSRTCAACHTQAYFWWKSNPHGRAYATLVEHERQLDLDCVGCHVTGYGRPGGSTVTHLEGLEGAGCESCHGPGSIHADNPRPPSRGTQRNVAESVCAGCHDPEHSDRFRFAEYVAKLRGRGHAERVP